MDETGKLSLDLLVGLSIFLFTFIFIAQFLPGVFADVRSEIALANQAYRVAVLLVEDSGVWYDSASGASGVDWETKLDLCTNPNILFRPGLINYNEENQKKNFNELDLSKLRNFTRVMQNCSDKVYDSMGLILNGSRIYHINLTLETLDSKPYDTKLCDINGETYAVGDALPQSGDVVRFERIVYFNASTSNGVQWGDRYLCKVVVTIW